MNNIKAAIDSDEAIKSSEIDDAKTLTAGEADSVKLM